MSELKDYRIPTRSGNVCHCYLKSEADKVIAELKESHKNEVKQLLSLNSEQADAANRLRDSMEQVILHNKYKRCLAMAKWCKRKRFDAADYRIPRGTWDFYDKWYKRWLDLAFELRELDSNIQKLKNAIAANPPQVREAAKALWPNQLEAMKAYKQALFARIRDLMDNDND